MRRDMQSFHDWFIVGVSSNMDTHELSLQLCDDYKTRSATLAFKGATRFIVESFIAQNIIYSTVVFDNPTSTEYQSARAKLEKAHPWGNNWPTKQIALISASLGAEVLVEFEEMQFIEVGPSI
jgi:hypothetical protein